MAASGDVEEAGEEEGDGEEEGGGGRRAASNNLICLTQFCLKISDDRQKIRLASIQHDKMPFQLEILIGFLFLWISRVSHAIAI